MRDLKMTKRLLAFVVGFIDFMLPEERTHG